tara:strand:- start:4825 stop:4968 length:144 start_codon:yes stop_codon:yes gene_type:complete
MAVVLEMLAKAARVITPAAVAAGVLQVEDRQTQAVVPAAQRYRHQTQ